MASATSHRAIALPAVALVAVMALATPVAPVAEPSPGDVDELTSTRLLTVQDPRIDEASGMVQSRVHKGVLWMVNDSGGGATVYGVDVAGTTVAELTLDGIENRDWEAMAPGVDDAGDPALWIADIGDNDTQWPSIRVYRIPEPESLGVQDVPWRRVELKYPDRAHNAETLLVDGDGRLFVVTKEGMRASVYATPDPPAPGTTVTLERVGPAPMFLTDGEISYNGAQVALRSYTSLYLFAADEFLSEGTDGDPGEVYPLPLQRQGETLTYARDDWSVLVGSEGVKQPVYLIGLPGTPGESGSSTSTAATGNGSSRSRWAAGLAAIVMVGAVSVLLLRRRGRTT